MLIGLLHSPRRLARVAVVEEAVATAAEEEEEADATAGGERTRTFAWMAETEVADEKMPPALLKRLLKEVDESVAAALPYLRPTPALKVGADVVGGKIGDVTLDDAAALLLLLLLTAEVKIVGSGAVLDTAFLLRFASLGAVALTASLCTAAVESFTAAGALVDRVEAPVLNLGLKALGERDAAMNLEGAAMTAAALFFLLAIVEAPFALPLPF
jgi:hypothetical protein